MAAYLVENRQFRVVLETLRKENPLVLGDLRFRQEDGKVYLCKGGDERLVEPYSAVLKDGSERFEDYDTGDGSGRLLEVLVEKGLSEEEAQELVDTIYDVLPEWVILPMAAMERIAAEREISYELVQEAQAFIQWLDDDEGQQGQQGQQGQSETAEVQEYEATNRAFHAAYFPISKETWDTLYETTNGSETKTSTETVCGESMIFRVEQGRLFVSNTSFAQEKECVHCTDAHVPARLCGFRLGDGPRDLIANLEQQSLSAADARCVAEQVYSYIDDHVCLPAAEVDKITLQGSVVLLHAGMINRAHEYSKWILHAVS